MAHGISPLQHQPYRLFFPLGIALAWAGIFHWVAFGLGWSAHYRSVFHSIAQVQGFLTCFAVGFLFTMIPRRTQTDPPAKWQLTLGAAAPVLTTALAWPEEFAWSQIPWIAMCIMLIAFAVRRFRSANAGRRPPVSFVWIPVGLVFGLIGVVLIALYGALKLDFSYHQLGRLFLLQGVFLALIVGVGGMILPLITRGESSTDSGPGDGGKRLAHVAVALALAGTFAVEVFGSVVLAYAARAILVLGLLLLQARIHLAPTKPGWHRWLVWGSAWALPIGYALGAILAPNIQPGLHTVFIAGFALMALTVGSHVSLAHGGQQELVHRTPWQVPLLAVLLFSACILRALVNLDPQSTLTWIAASAACFLLATLVWISLVFRALASPA